MDTAECIEYYPPYNASKDDERFGETGRLCHFRESLHPHKPWPHGCWIFQGKDPCNTYEISEDHSHVVSCDIPLKKGECIPYVKEPNTCLEWRARPKVVTKEITGASQVRWMIIISILIALFIAWYWGEKRPSVNDKID
jgi:hypothetical protein